MPYYIYSYDISSAHPDPHQAFVKAAIQRSMTYVYGGPEHLYRLPNTTIWGYANDLEGAASQFDGALTSATQAIGTKIVLEKRLISPSGKSWILSNKHKVPEQTLVGRTFLETCCNHQLRDPYFRY